MLILFFVEIIIYAYEFDKVFFLNMILIKIIYVYFMRYFYHKKIKENWKVFTF